MASRRGIQYTLRGVPLRVDEALRRKAQQQGKSLNQVALEALASGTGLTEEPILYHDLDSLAGTWVEDARFEEAVRAQDQVDPSLWQ
ncbi:hypothetical protein MYX84_09990 [Acidobacteria bacterium AH-259-O06]|nr:hypothetical protein [Acidobacteria bacterium AH-259-O06]